VKRTALFAAALLLPLHMTVAAAGDAAKPSIEERLIVANVGGKCGFVNERGKIVIPAIYDNVSPFYADGLASVADDSLETNQFIDKKGQIAFHVPKGAYVSDWDRNDEYLVIDNGGKAGFIDRTGKLVIPMIWDEAAGFAGAKLAPVKRGGFWGYIGRDGEIVIPMILTSASPFKDGKASVRIKGYGYDLSENGTLSPATLPAAYAGNPYPLKEMPIGSLYYHSEANKAGISTANVKTGDEPNLTLVDKDGKPLGQQYSHMGRDYGDNPTPVRHGFIGSDGKVAIPFIYDEVRGFNGGNGAIVSYKGKWGLIDRKGKWLIKPKFDRLGECSPPMYRVERQ
jgi:hypothetical protein